MEAGEKLRIDMQKGFDQKHAYEKSFKSDKADGLPMIDKRRLPTLKELRPTSDELLKMTVKQKGELVAKLKFVERRRSMAVKNTNESLLR